MLLPKSSTKRRACPFLSDSLLIAGHESIVQFIYKLLEVVIQASQADDDPTWNDCFCSPARLSIFWYRG